MENKAKYHTVHSLKFGDFINIHEEAKYHLLLINGKANTEDLQLVWDQILLDYYDLIDSPTTKYYVSIVKEILKLESQSTIVVSIVSTWLGTKDNRLIELLSKNGFSLNESDSKEKVLQQLEFFVKNIHVKVTRLKKQLEDLSSNNTSVSITRTVFLENINTISKHNKFYVNENEITLARYALMLKDYQNYVESVKENSQNGQ